MILLDTTTRRLRVVLGGAGALPFLACWSVIETSSQDLTGEGANPGVTDGATPVDLVGVPGAGTVRKVVLVQMRNSTAGEVVATIRYDDNGTARDIASFSLAQGDVLQYADGEGWRVLDSTGAVKSGTGTAPEPEPAPDYDAQQMALLALMEF